MSAVVDRGLPAAAPRRPIPPFTAEHEELRREIRAFVEGELRPHAPEWEEAHWFPPTRSFGLLAERGAVLGLKFERTGGQPSRR